MLFELRCKKHNEVAAAQGGILNDFSQYPSVEKLTMTMCKINHTMAFQNWPNLNSIYFLFGSYQSDSLV